MRRILAVAFLLEAVSPLFAQAPEPLVYPQPGSDIPGSFTSYIATGKRKGKYHCLVTEHDLNPVVMIVVRGTELTRPLRELLIKVDNAIDKNPNERLAGFAVFLTDKLTDLAQEKKVPDDFDIRDELETKLGDIQKDAGLKHLTLALNLKDKLKDYKVDDQVEVAVLLYHRFQTESLHLMTREQLTDAKVKEILGEIATKLGARR